ncbi:MAG: DUF1311 domain-containing protein [Chlorobi bacterium]|nr:DUF1311 domain-containing protein [Chlorobiota bacterium]
MKKLFVLLFLFLIPVIVLPQEAEEEHEIDTWLGKCLENNYSDYDMAICFQTAEEKWDKDLNVVYRKLIKNMDKKEKSALKKSQREWVKWRDKEFKLLISIYDSGGTMDGLMISSDRMSIVKARVIDLLKYLAHQEQNN